MLHDHFCIALHDATVVEILCECHNARCKVHIDEYSDCVVHYERILTVISSRIYSIDSVQRLGASAGAEPLRVVPSRRANPALPPS